MKTCQVCRQSLPLTEFYPCKDSPDGLRNDCKPCVRARTNRRRLAKPELIKAKKKRWTAQNRERLLEYKRAWYEEHRDEAIARAKEWVKNNPQQRRETWLRWYETNPAIRHSGSAKRRALVAGAETCHIPNRDWMRLIRRYNGLCAYCQSRPWLHRDHVIPLSRGGRHSIGNLLPSCRVCNFEKKDRLLSEWKAGKPRPVRQRVAEPA